MLAADDASRFVEKIVREMAPSPAEWNGRDSRLIEDLGYHSLAILELAFVLEDELNLPPLDESATTWIRTVGDLEEHVTSLLAEAS